MGRSCVDGLPERFGEAYVEILEVLCSPSEFSSMARSVLKRLSEVTECEAVALRVHDRRDDYPYFVYSGFEERFIEKESALCHRGAGGAIVRDECGLAELECMCGLVVRGRTEPEKPFFTEGGSFWTNSTTQLLANSTDESRGTVTRNLCNIWGYESVGLVPLRAGETMVGLLQLNSRQRDRFSPTIMGFLEGVGCLAGSAVETSWRREELRRLSLEFGRQRGNTETLVALDEMAATLAHEIKNPLAGMMLSATRLKKALRGQEKLVSIADSLSSGINLLSETVSRMSGSVRRPLFEAAPVRIDRVIESAMSLMTSRAEAQDVRIVRSFHPELPEIKGDAHFLMRAFLNLIVNSLEAMPSSGLLRLEAKPADNGGVEAIIADTGIGIDADDAEALFDPFVTTKSGGAGLGLGIVRRICELHSGTIMLRPGSDGGTEAIVRLPGDLERAASDETKAS